MEYFIQHTIRSVYDEYGQMIHNDSGFYFRELDRLAHKTIKSVVAPEIVVPQEQMPMCDQLPFCGLPLITSRHLHCFNGYWLPGEAPIIKDEAKLKLNKRTVLSDTETQLDFTISGENIFSNWVIKIDLTYNKRLQAKCWSRCNFVPDLRSNYPAGTCSIRAFQSQTLSLVTASTSFLFGTDWKRHPLMYRLVWR